MDEARTGHQRPAAKSRAFGRERRLTATIATHRASLLRVARRYSLCADDAHDAVQRTLEIYLRRADDLDPATLGGWLRTVVKHEALAVRRGRVEAAWPGEPDWDEDAAREQPGLDDRLAALEFAARGREALGRLKPHERHALVLQGHGFSYDEIRGLTGWTYTKVNRCLTEGRRALRDAYAAIEGGAACREWERPLEALAAGAASRDEIEGVRPHLAHCPRCRAALRRGRAALGAASRRDGGRPERPAG